MRLIDADELKTKLPSDTLEDFSIACAVCKIIDEQPTIETELIRHGQWEEVMTNVYIGCIDFEEVTCNELECSECGYGVNIEDHSAYCPNCGAKMEENDRRMK